MFSTSARSLFTPPSTTHFPKRHHNNHHFHRRLSLTTTRITMSTTPETIEHIVLIKVKDNTDQSQITTMVNGLNGLKSLDMVLHLTTGPVHQNLSTSLKFTHILHSRYKTKEDLAQYSAHQAHLNVVRSTVLPICDDLMAVDWVTHNLNGPISPNPGSIMRVQFIKLKEGVSEKEKEEVIGVINGLKEKIEGIDQFSVGENFSEGRAKGFSIASIRVFPGFSELDLLNENDEIGKGREKIKDYIDSIVAVEYVIPDA